MPVDRHTERVQLADSHLTYVRSSDWRMFNSVAVYDVYPAGGGPQLGWVYRRNSQWFARSMGLHKGKDGRTRWEAATSLWATS